MKTLLSAALLWALALVPALAQSVQMRPVATFRAINVGTGIELTLTAGSAQRVEVSAATDDYRNHIETTVDNGVLTLRYKNLDERARDDRTNKHLRASVTADQLTALTAGSGSTVRTSGNFAAAQEFRLDVSSGAAVKANLATAALTVHQSSGSTIDLSGRAAHLDLRRQRPENRPLPGRGQQRQLGAHCREGRPRGRGQQRRQRALPRGPGPHQAHQQRRQRKRPVAGAGPKHHFFVGETP
jgi:hypothetical protein